MNYYLRRFFPYVFLAVLIAANIGVYVSVLHAPPATHELQVSVLNIGQGDSILVIGPTGRTMLVDGGPDRSVVRDLSIELGPLNRHIDMIVETHPDADHIGGLAYVFEQYAVSFFMTPGIPDATNTFKRVEAAATAEPGLRRITATRGMRIDLGGGAYADVLYPDRDMSKETTTNDGSTVLHVVYGKTSFMLTGDLPIPVENWLVALDGTDGELKSDVLKVGHHGSKYSSGDSWLAAVAPSIAAISVGKNNSYGHPSPDALGRLKSEGAQVVATEDVGTIDFYSDGEKITEKNEGL